RGLAAQPGLPAAPRVTPVREEPAVLDRGPPPGPERGVVSCPIGGVLEIERPVAGERDPARRQPVHPEAAPRGADADVRRQLTGTRTDRRRARAEEQGAPVGVPLPSSPRKSSHCP